MANTTKTSVYFDRNFARETYYKDGKVVYEPIGIQDEGFVSFVQRKYRQGPCIHCGCTGNTK